jgi:hypothetical protein
MLLKAGVEYGIREATIEDAHFLSTRLRAIDSLEVGLVGRSDEGALVSGLKTSEFCRVGTVDGEPVCMYGVRRLSSLSGNGIIWMLGTDKLEKHAMKFVRECGIQLKDMIRNFDHVENWCHPQNKITKRWLKWLGFKFDAPEKGIPFQRFYMDNTLKAEDWEFKLAMFLNGRVESPFQWGGHDCCLFLADAILEMTGFDVAEFFRGKYTDRETAFELMKEYSGGSVVETWDKAAEVHGFREISPDSVQVGDIATIKVKALDPIAYELSNGVSVGINVKDQDFLSPGRKGLTQSRNPEIVKAWRI